MRDGRGDGKTINQQQAWTQGLKADLNTLPLNEVLQCMHWYSRLGSQACEFRLFATTEAPSAQHSIITHGTKAIEPQRSY